MIIRGRVWATVEQNMVVGVSGGFEQRVERVPVFYRWVGERMRDRSRGKKDGSAGASPSR